MHEMNMELMEAKYIQDNIGNINIKLIDIIVMTIMQRFEDHLVKSKDSKQLL